jgi:flagellar biosynthesis anti-sigma factor FlgM
MTMKIEPHRPGAAEADASQRVEAQARRTPRAEEASSPQGDRVEVSDDAKKVQQLVAEAVKSVSNAPEVRQDKVERAKELLASGELGKDHQKLASAIIDDLLEQP